MRAKNSRLETLLNELQAFVDLQKKEIETLQQATNKDEPLTVEALQSPPVDMSYPCDELDEEELPNEPGPSFLPDDEEKVRQRSLIE
jgi:hypothetical protein